ncbi:MAG: 4-hydroxy-3-methylbut-2-enyl diphosphate reductase, partial [Planctomycetota bacterium]|nr:4-hydroxy-3-methylbut-2-enyl diphosphate reductase [Planctomycetota bacterium]
MRVLLAATSGFCGGVKRAMRLALSAAEKGEVEADGPLVHNRQALELLTLRGVGRISSPEGVSAAPGRMLIRAHGVPPERRRRWLAEGRE